MPGATVVVVDDDPETLETIAEILHAEAFTAVAARDGASALKLLRAAAPPRVAIIDLMMPQISGWDLVGLIREDSELASSTAIVTCTAATGWQPPPDTIYLRKPFSVEQLLSAVDEALSRLGQRSASPIREP